MNNSERQPVYDAMNGLPEMLFAALLYAISSVNKVFALTLMDDPTPCKKLDDAIQPFIKKLG